MVETYGTVHSIMLRNSAAQVAEKLPVHAWLSHSSLAGSSLQVMTNHFLLFNKKECSIIPGAFIGFSLLKGSKVVIFLS